WWWCWCIERQLVARDPRSLSSKHLVSQMKHIFKIIAMLVAVSAIWIALLETATVPRSYTWLLPIYLVVALGCYGLFMVGFGLMFFPTCPQEAVLLQQDILEAKEFLSKKGVDVGSE
uniref:Dolichol-phosphate mannosyltransferase subunit 3 n=1 Tax=Oryza glaberrima TaxID=4538 RepID=I1P4A7_ORYGL